MMEHCKFYKFFCIKESQDPISFHTLNFKLSVFFTIQDISMQFGYGTGCTQLCTSFTHFSLIKFALYAELQNI